MTSWGELEEILNDKIAELVKTGTSYMTQEEYDELAKKEYELMLTEPREVYERDIIMVSRVMKKVYDDDGNEVINPETGLPLEIPTKNVSIDLPLTAIQRVRGLGEYYLHDVSGNDDKLTVEWGCGTTKQITINNVAKATAADTAGTADVATKLGTATVGSGVNHIYLNGGTPTASSSNVGGTAQPMYLNAGTMTACSASVGSADTPVYMDNGTLKACSESLGGNGGGLTVAVYSGYSGNSNPVYQFNSVSGSFTATNYECVLLFIPSGSTQGGNVSAAFDLSRQYNVDGTGTFSVYNPSGSWANYDHGNPLLVMFYENRWYAVGVYGTQLDTGGGDGGGE